MAPAADRRKLTILALDPAQGGGVSTVVEFLLRGLDGSDAYQVRVVTCATSSQDAASVRLLKPRTWFKGIQVERRFFAGIDSYHVGGYLVEWEGQRYRPRRELNRFLEEADLIQVVSGTAAPAFVASAVTTPKCAFIATTAAQERRSAARQLPPIRRAVLGLRTRSHAAFERAALKTLTCIFAESEYTRSAIGELPPKVRVVVAPPGVDIAFFRPADMKSEGHILAVGRFADPRKNVRLLFHAYAGLRSAVQQCPPLLLAGYSMPTERDWMYARSLGIADAIITKPSPSSHELAQIYRHAHFLVLSSDEEGLGIVLLEAMASGVPVVATECGGPTDVVQQGQTGFLCPSGDAEALGSRMRLMLENSNLRWSMGAAARALVECRFSIKTAIRPYLEEYRRILSPRV